MPASIHEVPKLVVFDVEGVLIPKNRFLFEMGKILGFIPLLKVFLYGFLYEIGLIQLKSALRKIFASARGLEVETLISLASKVPLVPGVEDVFRRLKAQGCKTAIVSSGLPAMAVKVVANEIGADYSFGFEVGVEGSRLAGEIWGDVIERNGKLAVLSRIVAYEHLSPGDCAVVADDRNNASIFLKEAFKIAYNPDFILRIKADSVVTGRISKVLAVINGEPKHRGKPSRNDVLRELIHASGIFVPIVAMKIGVPVVATSIILVLGIYSASEYLRTVGKRVPVIYLITRKAASPNELYQLVLAPVYFALGILFALLLFPYPANYAAIAIFALGDSAASIFGGIFSKTLLPFNKDKSFEGSAAGFLFAFLGGCIFVSPLVALVGAVVAMVVEFLPLPVNDNLMIPLCTGIALALILR
ncbi:MAG TPA: HAD family hydrolase [Candidatus Bathyarchaeia archaeon]